jgi:MFS family permease
MMGIFLPFTIYLQSALGFSALKAGLTLAPASIISMFVAPVAGRMTDKIGGKYILLSGLMFFAIGFGLTAVIATTTSQWQDFIWTLAIAGLGMGCTFAPMTTIAMRNIEPRVAGAASGMINTVRQVGAVIGTAAVGALLQNRLAAALPVAAAEHSRGLPPGERQKFVTGFAKSAAQGSAANPTQGSGIKLPSGTPASVATELHKLASEVFSAGYVTAMHSTMIWPVALLVVASLSCLGIKRGVKPARPAGTAAADAATLPEASQAPA